MSVWQVVLAVIFGWLALSFTAFLLLLVVCERADRARHRAHEAGVERLAALLDVDGLS